jgi:hypothetical protein
MNNTVINHKITRRLLSTDDTALTATDIALTRDVFRRKMNPDPSRGDIIVNADSSAGTSIRP